MGDEKERSKCNQDRLLLAQGVDSVVLIADDLSQVTGHLAAVESFDLHLVIVSDGRWNT